MAVVTHSAKSANGNSVRFYLADAETELASLANSEGDYAYAKDTDRFFVATAVGTWKAAPTMGQATVPFATFASEDSISITGQAGVVASSRIQACIYADNDDVYAQDWNDAKIRNIIVGVGFDILLRPAVGSFQGNVKVNWSWL